MKTTLFALTVFIIVMSPMLVTSVNADAITPQEFMLELQDTIREADNALFRGYFITNTKQLKDALIHKIDIIIRIMDHGDYNKAVNKLRNDLSPKLTICDTNRVRARSWLSYLHDPQQDVYAFSEICQDLITRAITLAEAS